MVGLWKSLTFRKNRRWQSRLRSTQIPGRLSKSSRRQQPDHSPPSDPVGRSLGEVSDLDERTDLVPVGGGGMDGGEIAFGSKGVEMKMKMIENWRMTGRSDVAPKRK